VSASDLWHITSSEWARAGAAPRKIYLHPVNSGCGEECEDQGAEGATHVGLEVSGAVVGAVADAL